MMKNLMKFFVATGITGVLLGSIIQFPSISQHPQQNISECKQGLKTFSKECARRITVKILKDYLWE